MLSDAKQKALELRLRGTSTPVGERTPAITPAPADGPAPVSFAQQRLWFLDQLDPGSVEYNAPLALRLRGPLDVAALGAALDGVVDRHEILRTRLVAGDGVPHQLVDPAGGAALEVVDVSGEADPAAAADALVADDEATRFDVAAGPPFRARLVRLAPDDHVLSLVMHHLVTDEWSEGILRRELATLYRAHRAGQPSPLPPLPVQYRDVARWQRGWLQGEVLDAQLGYWRDHLAGAPALELPTDRPRPRVRSSAGAVVDFELPAATGTGLQAVARDAGATMFMTLLAVWSVVLGRHAGVEDVVVGTPVANRDRPEVEGLIGPFLNTLVLRTDLAGDPTFAELLARVRHRALASYAHQDLPFEQLVEALQPQRDRARTPLFQVLFSFEQQAGDGEEPGFPDLDVVEYADRRTTSRFDLSLFLAADGGVVGGTVEYRTELFDRGRIERLAGHLVTLAGAVARDPQRRLSELSLLDTGEHRQVTLDWNATDRPLAADPVHHLVAARARRRPDATAVVFAGRSLSYGELESRANRLAHHLRARGAGPEAVVGVCLDRGVDLVVALLAVLKAGAAYLPLDPAHPAERRALLLEDSEASLVVGSRAGPRIPGQVVALDDPATADALAAAPADPPEVPTDPGHLAYVMYTSGSTGRPKAVMVPHRGMTNRLAWMQDAYRLTPDDRVLHKTPATFDVSLWELLWPLTAGAALVVAAPGQHRDLEALAALMGAERVSVVHFVPSLLHELVTGVAPPELAGLGALRLVVCSGEALAGQDVARFHAAHPTAVVENLYGPTEASIDVSAWRCRREDGAASPPIGRPIANTQLHVLDPHLASVPVGVPGELHVGGVGLARGYRSRPALTAARFVADPVGDGGGRLYRTGDRARWRPDGALEFLGRVDEQVKVRGHRIEPGEVEAALVAHPALADAAVVAHGAGAERHLVAYVVPDPGAGAGPSTGDLRSHLTGRLPGEMVPSAFVALEALPLTPHGKLDRAALPAPDGVRPDVGTTFVPPRTPTEEVLAALWAGVLALDRVGVDDDFFALGGHSLLATQLVSRLRTAFGVELALAELFDHPTVAELAAVVDAAACRVPAPPVTPVPRDQPLPLSFAQQRLWFVEQLEPGSVEYNVPFAVRLAGPLDVPALRAALDLLVERHEVLRTRLVATDGVAHQVIDPPHRFPLEWVDLSDRPDAREAAERLVAEDAVVRFALDAGPLCRGRLVRVGPEDHVLSLVLHHVVCDEWSLGVLRRELSVLYAAACGAGRPSPLAPLTVQYGDFARWQREWLQGEVLDAQLGYWRDRLAGVPVLDLPTDRPRPAVRTAVGASIAFEVPAEVVAGLRALSRTAGGTMFMVLLSAYCVVLGRYAGQTDVAVGTPLANRNRAEVEGLIGLFVNTLVMRTDLAGDPTFAEVVDRVRQEALGAHAHQDLPFEQLVDLLQPDRDRSRTPFFQVVFNYEHDRGDPLRLGDLTASLVDVPQATVLCDLRLVLVEEDGALAGTIEYSTDLFDPTTVECLAGHLVTLLGAVAEDPHRPISRMPLLTDAERRQVTEGWNRTARTVPAVGGVHELVAAHAARRPRATAVAFGEEVLTYGELDTRANRLAHHLTALGVGPDVVVGVCLEPSVDLVVALLAVLKAGGAYLALDPDYPAPRLSYMLADSRVPVLMGREAVLDRLPVHRARSVVVDDPATAAAVQRAPATAPAVVAHGDQLAYVMYTSGSTGEPKGIGVCHRGVVSLVTVGDYVAFQPDDVVAQVSTPSFDAATFEVWGALANGATLLGIDRRSLLDPRVLAGELERHRATVLLLTPALLNRVAAEAPEGLCHLRYLLTGGDVADPTSLRRVLRDGRPRHLVNAYGPAEATVIVACHQVDEVDGDALPIGRPIGNVRAYVLDPSMTPLPAGVPGELFAGGAGVARGYPGRGALTAERFVADPLAADGSRLYRTGDRARWRADGVLEFLGRVDDQVKVRGFRIEPGEVEAALLAHADVAAAVVVVRDDDEGARRLVAYAVPRDVQVGIPSPGDLRSFLGATLPGHMVPSLFVELDALPLSPNGKVDRSALPAPDAARAGRAAGDVAPRTPTEEVLAAAWAEVLGLDRVGVHDNFFELGGDSIMSIQAVARARRAGVHVTPAQLFEQQTVAGLAGVADREAPVGAEQGPVVGEVPMTPIQRWFFERDLPDPHHYNQSLLLALTPDRPVDPVRLEAALAAVVEHHDALRSRYRRADGEVVQSIAASGPGELLSVVEVADRDEGAAARMQAVGAACQAGLDLEAGRLVRAVLFEPDGADPPDAPDGPDAADGPGAAGQALLLVIHHLVVDGVSWRILAEDLAVAYEQLERGEAVRLPPKTTSFKRWVEHLVALAASTEVAAEADHWLGVGRGLALPSDRDGAGERNTVASARTVEVALDVEPTSRLLREVPATYRTQVNDVLLTALAVVLTEWCGAPAGTPVVVDLEGHGREELGGDVDLSRTVGWFTTLFPVALAVEGTPVDLAATLVATKERLRRVPRRGLGYGLLRYLSTGEAQARLAATPGAEVSFNYLGRFEPGRPPATGDGGGEGARFTPAEHSLGPEQAASGRRTHVLEVDGVVTGDRLRLAWTYSEHLHDHDTVAALARRFVEVLEELVEHCRATGPAGYAPSDFPLAALDQSSLDLLHDELAQSLRSDR